VTDGAAIAFCEHTTCALLINEWEAGALADFRRHLTELVPHEGVYYAHDDFDVRTQNMHDDERKNGHAHVKAMLLSATSHAIPVSAGEPAFGIWQRLIFVELDEPKARRVTFHVFGL
jgi:secondary thiamine-phosphate synthase enzyme